MSCPVCWGSFLHVGLDSLEISICSHLTEKLYEVGENIISVQDRTPEGKGASKGKRMRPTVQGSGSDSKQAPA